MSQSHVLAGDPTGSCLDRLEQKLHGLFVGAEVGGEPALVTDGR